MVRESRLRLTKWDKKIDPSIVLQRFSTLKDISKEQLDPYLIQVTAIEKRVKELLEAKGVTPTLIAFYLSYARELLGKTFGSISSETLRNEELAIRSKWVNRGLEDSNLKEIAKMFGIDPKPLPLPVEVFKIINDFETSEDLAKVQITVPNGVNYELSNENSFTGNKSIKFTGNLDFRHGNDLIVKFDIDLSKFKSLGMYFYWYYGTSVRKALKGYNENDELVFEYYPDTIYSSIIDTWELILFNKKLIENWDLAKKVEIHITGSGDEPLFIDTIIAQIV
jgi:hypothetical protein